MLLLSEEQKPQVLMDDYVRLSNDEQRILQVLAVIYIPLNQTKLQDVVNRLGFVDSKGNQPLSRLIAKPLRERFLLPQALFKVANQSCEKPINCYHLGYFDSIESTCYHYSTFFNGAKLYAKPKC